jgi:hypothetical protein
LPWTPSRDGALGSASSSPRPRRRAQRHKCSDGAL